MITDAAAIRLAASWLPVDRWRVEPITEVQSLNNRAWRWLDPDGVPRYVGRLRNAAGSTGLGVAAAVERRQVEAAAAAGVAPTLIGYDDEAGLLVSTYVTAERTWTDRTVADPEQRSRLLASLAALHAIPAEPGWPTIFEQIDGMLGAAVRLGLRLPDELDRVAPRLAAIARVDRRRPAVLTHHDVWPNNVIDDGDRVWLIDFEFAGSGSGLYDLAAVAMAAGLEAGSAAEAGLLEAYAGLAGDDHRFEPGELRDARWVVRHFEAAWGLLRSRLSPPEHQDFDFAGHAARMISGLAAE